MKPETVTLELQVPKGILVFLKEFFEFSGYDEPVEEFLANELVGSVKSILGDLPNSWFDSDKLLKRYGLDKE